MPLGEDTGCCGIDTLAGQGGGGGVTPSDITLQAALDGQNAEGIPTEQSYVTAIDLNSGASWSWRNTSNAPMVTITDGTGLDVQQAVAFSGHENVTLPGGTTNDQAVATTTTVLRVTPNAAGSAISSLTGGRDGRLLVVFNVSTTNTLVLTNNAGGTAANRFLLPGTADLTVAPNSGVLLQYDSTSIRWRLPAGSAATVTLQQAIDGQGTTSTEQTFATAIDLNTGASWSWRDASNNSMLSVADGTGVTIAEGFQITGVENVTLAGGTTNDQAVLATTTVLRITPNAAGSTLTGIATPRSGRLIFIYNVSATNTLVLSNDTGSAAQNRFLCPNAQNITVPPNGAAIIWDDATTSRWRITAVGAFPVTLQNAINGQGATQTEQSIVTTVDLNGGVSWTWRDNADLALFSISDVTGVGVAQALALTGTISPAALAAGNNNNYTPTGGATANTERLTPNAAGSTITGIAGGTAGRRIEIFNISTTASITLTHNDTANSTAANCFLLPNAASVVIPPLGSVVIWYDTTSSRWRIDGAAGASIAPGTTQIQDFTSTAGGTFNVTNALTAGFTTARVIIIAAGGGGGGGGSSTTPGGGALTGGSGGGGGARCEGTFRLSELTSTVAITVGAGGLGGNGGSNAPGSDGATGGNSSFGTYLVAGAGAGGTGSAVSQSQSGGGGGGIGSAGTTAAVGASNVQGGGGPGVASTTNPTQGSASGGKGGGGVNSNSSPGGAAEWGGAGGGGGTSAATAAGGSSWWGGAGGGTGGGHNTVGAVQNGSAGGSQRSVTAGGGGAPGTTGSTTSPGSAGTNGDFTNPGTAGGGGGGIANGVSNQPGGRGGDGGLYGNGGGGGGATAGNGAGSPQPGGRGGDGAQGAVRVILS